MVNHPNVLLLLLGLNRETLILERNILKFRFDHLHDDIISLFVLFHFYRYLGDLQAHNSCDRVECVLSIQVDVEFRGSFLIISVFILIIAFRSCNFFFLLILWDRW
jgi:hypothetical protein